MSLEKTTSLSFSLGLLYAFLFFFLYKPSNIILRRNMGIKKQSEGQSSTEFDSFLVSQSQKIFVVIDVDWIHSVICLLD